eukprot:382282-Lingulodinium_polyedra.AAC.1
MREPLRRRTVDSISAPKQHPSKRKRRRSSTQAITQAAPKQHPSSTDQRTLGGIIIDCAYKE